MLGLLVDGSTHGFAVAAEIGPGSSLGRIWKVPRPLVYRAVTTLEERGLVERTGVEPAVAGPPRVLLRVTAAGAGAFHDWLELPVAHLRDLRSELLVKLWFHERLGSDPLPLLTGQRAQLGAFIDTLRAEPAGAAPFDATLRAWRLHSAQAALEFLDEQLSNGAPSAGAGS